MNASHEHHRSIDLDYAPFVRGYLGAIENGAAGDALARFFTPDVAWIGTLAIPLRSRRAGDTLRARFCMLLELEGGRIRRQRNYDCFEPF